MNVNALEHFAAIMQLDLAPIKMKLMHIESGEAWSAAKANTVEKEYRRFLCLMKMFPEENIAPLVDVDTFWHYHILDTLKYARDCEQAFGYFLHHYPYVGLRGGNDEQCRIDSGERMGTLYEAAFGEAYPGSSSGAVQASAFCAGPAVQAIAYCAGPAVQASAFRAIPGATIAYCAGPAVQAGALRAGPGANTAYCAGPAAKAGARGGACMMS
jgi:hypothetical protein